MAATTTFDEVIDSPEEMRLYQQERSIEFVTAMISRVMKEKGVTRAELARRLNHVPGWVTQVLDGERNKTIRTLSDLLWALGESLEFGHQPITTETDTVSRNVHSAKANFLKTVEWQERGAPAFTTATTRAWARVGR